LHHHFPPSTHMLKSELPTSQKMKKPYEAFRGKL
jgi:hypothetical protein